MIHGFYCIIAERELSMLYKKEQRLLEDLKRLQAEGASDARLLYVFIVENMRWSFSRLNGFHGCRYCWFQTYVLKEKGVGNVFSDYGLLMHELLEDFLNEKIFFWDLLPKYEENFINLPSFPPNKFVDLREKYYNDGLSYLTTFDGFQGYEVLAVEQEINTNINGYPLIGYIDLLLKDKKDGRIIVVDHKSKAEFKTKKEKQEYSRQMYLYCKGVYELFGEYPKEMRFNMFRKKNMEIVIFKEKDMNEAFSWMMDTIAQIKDCTTFGVTDDEFFGEYLCNHRDKNAHKIGFLLNLEEGMKGLT